MSTLAIASILEELRCMDGELFKAEICQRLFLWLKTQANESLESAYTKTPAEYAKVLEMYRSWPLEVSREELLTLQEKAGGAEELQSAWVAVSLHWVRLHKKADGNASGKTSVKIKTPDPRDVLKNFFVSLCSKSWCVRGDLWSMDPVKQDFVFREVFRQSVGNSVHFLQEVTESSREDFSSSSTRKEEEGKGSIRQEVKNVAREEEKQSYKPEEDSSANQQKSFERNKLKLELESPPKDSLPREKPEFTKKEETNTIFQSTDNKTQPDLRSSSVGVLESESSFRQEEQQIKEKGREDEDQDDIGPDDSVSQFFSGQSPKESKFLPTFSSPTPPARRYADAGTVMYSSAPRRVLVKPITLNLENPIQKSLEE